MIDATTQKTVSFLLGFLISAIAMYNFMESRIEKQAQESLILGQLKAQMASQKSQHWTDQQNNITRFSELNTRMSTLEAREALRHSNHEDPKK